MKLHHKPSTNNNDLTNGIQPTDTVQQLSSILKATFPIIKIPEQAIKVWDGVARDSDSSIFLDKENGVVYKHYEYIKPLWIQYYHWLHNAISWHSWEKKNPRPEEVKNDGQIIDTIKISVLPLDPQKIYSDGNMGSITTPVYVPWTTLADVQKWLWFKNAIERTNIGLELANDIKAYVKDTYDIHEPHIDISPSNIKMYAVGNTLYFLITDIATKIVDIVYNKWFDYTKTTQKIQDLRAVQWEGPREELKAKEEKIKKVLSDKAPLSYELPEPFNHAAEEL